MKVSRVPKGKDKVFAAGGTTPMFGKADRTKSAYPAEPQRPGQTSGQAASPKPVRRSAVKRITKVPVDTAGDMGGTGGSSQPRRPAA
jgi:hypothetical protein